MITNDNFVYNELVREYLNTFINLNKILQNQKDEINSGIIDNVTQYELIELINNKLSYLYDNLINDMNKVISWWNSYNDNISLLGSGFVKNIVVDGEFENTNFIQAKEILNEELK